MAPQLLLYQSQMLAMKLGCYSLEGVQHGCQSCTASPTHKADAYILHVSDDVHSVLEACYLMPLCLLCFWFWALL